MSMYNMLRRRHRMGFKMAHGWIICGIYLTLLTQIANPEPIPHTSRNDLDNSKDALSSGIQEEGIAPTTEAPPSGLGLMVAPPTSKEALQGLGGGSKESASGVGSRESQTLSSGAGSSEPPLSTPGAGSREHASSKSNEESREKSSSSSGVGLRESSSGVSVDGSRESSSSRSSESSPSGVGSRDSLSSSGVSGGGSREHANSRSRETSGDSSSGPSGTGSREGSSGFSGVGSRERTTRTRSRESHESETTTVPHNSPVLPPIETETDSSVPHDLNAGIGVILSQEVGSGQPEPEVRHQQYSKEEFDSLTDFPNTAHVRKSRDAQQVTSNPTSGRGRIQTSPGMSHTPEDGMMDVEAVVRTLQTQVLESQTSQARTR